LDAARVREAEQAIAVLKAMNSALPEIPIPKLPSLGVVDALRATGVTVEIEDPALDDYREAETRAALHLAPHPPLSDSDEMRDLVIWQVAIRIAKRDGGACMVSRDEVHVHERGASEAGGVRLYRARNFEEAVEVLLQKSPIGVLEALRKVAAERLHRRLPIHDRVKTADGRSAASQVDRALAESRLESEGLDTKILGFVSYLGDPSKDQLFDMLGRAGVREGLARNTADKLVIAGLLVDTGNHYLVKNREAGEAAALLVEPEIIRLLAQE